MDKTTSQMMQAEVDIDNACNDVESTFKRIHDKLNEEEQKMLSTFQATRRNVKKKGDVTLDNQSMALVMLDTLKSCQIRLADKDSPYDYATVTESILRDVNNQYTKEFPGIMWSSQIVKTNKSLELRLQARVDFAEAVVTENVETEVRRIRLHAQNEGDVHGMVVHNQRVYAVHDKGSIEYCYTPDGSLSHKYEHKGGEAADAWEMCLVKDGDTVMLVVSDAINESPFWIKINDNGAKDHHYTQQVTYRPRELCNDEGYLLVCDAQNHKIHRYRYDGQMLAVINLTCNVKPGWVTRDRDQYVVSDGWYSGADPERVAHAHPFLCQIL